jgi:hypothetical protein
MLLVFEILNVDIADLNTVQPLSILLALPERLHQTIVEDEDGVRDKSVPLQPEHGTSR